MDIGPSEAETFWTEFLRKLRRRGLRGVQLVISDAHEGIKATVAKLMNASWQRCRVHTMRNALAHAGKSGRRVVSAFMATAFAQDSAEAAKGRRILILLADRLAAKVDFDMRSLFRQLFRGAKFPAPGNQIALNMGSPIASDQKAAGITLQLSLRFRGRMRRPPDAQWRRLLATARSDVLYVSVIKGATSFRRNCVSSCR